MSYQFMTELDSDSYADSSRYVRHAFGEPSGLASARQSCEPLGLCLRAGGTFLQVTWH